MGKGFGGLGGILREAQKQAQALQEKMAQLENELKERVVEGSAGGGMVTALVNGKRQLLAVKISPQVVDPKDVEMLEDLVAAAVNQAMKKAEEMRQNAIQRLAEGAHIPGLSGLL